MLKNIFLSQIRDFYNILQKLAYCPIVSCFGTCIKCTSSTHTHPARTIVFSLGGSLAVCQLSLSLISVYTVHPQILSVTCTLSAPLFPLNLPSHACIHARTRVRTHDCCLAFIHLFKTGSTVGNMLVTYVACLLSLSEKLFVCGWASAYVSPMTIRSGLLWRLEQRRCGGEKMGNRLCGTETSIICTTLPSSGQKERWLFVLTSANFCTHLSLWHYEMDHEYIYILKLPYAVLHCFTLHK